MAPWSACAGAAVAVALTGRCEAQRAFAAAKKALVRRRGVPRRFNFESVKLGSAKPQEGASAGASADTRGTLQAEPISWARLHHAASSRVGRGGRGQRGEPQTAAPAGTPGLGSEDQSHATIARGEK